MANSFLTPSIIAQEALMQLQNNLVLGALVNKDYSDEFAGKVGDTITVRRPNTFDVDEFTSSIRIQDVNETGVPVKLDKLLDISFAVTNSDMQLKISQFSEQFIIPAMLAFSQEIDARLADLANDIPYVVGTPGTPPSTVDDIAAVRELMNNNKVPMNMRRLVLGPAAERKLLSLDAFHRADASGSTMALREAELGRVLGYDTYMDQNVVKVDDVAGTLTVGANASAGATSIQISGATSAVVPRGTVFTIAGDPTTYVVTSEATVSSGSATVDIYPALKAAATNSSAITAKAGHTKNIAFHRNAFSLVSRTLEPPRGNANVATISDNGIGLRVVMDYDIRTKTDIVSIDGLFGFCTLQPELAAVLMG